MEPLAGQAEGHFALVREADDRGWFSLSLEQITKLAQLSARAVTNCLPELSALGELSYTPGSGSARRCP
ncbi:hypothetical protein [Streptomyces acidiscabies]|uniref:hypothetical protein n=1 Tax=Streptomyces acidiscabies TaxID=42234 RepID=UPI00096469A4|nr:hypothetical protein [Streptomyces acidiscabies]GAV37320.1 hypothetical protein Saa2_00193 [Streptomyces acidiscabies]